MLTPDDLAFDQRHIWHPYTSMSQPLPCYPVVAAQGAELEMADGRRLVDGMSSWWAAIHGYNHPAINAAIQDQLGRMAHVMFGGITHPQAVALCRRLLAVTPEALECIFLADSGSVAVEVALKMAMQYWQARGQRRQRFLTIRHGYHGDTLGAMSVCDPQGAMHGLYQGYLPQHLFVRAPRCGFHDDWSESDAEPLLAALQTQAPQIAAVILEPIVQGAGGMRFYHPRYLQRVREACDHHGILLIADEIATGFGRTGKYLACEHAGIAPDILCLGKALTGGYLTLAAALCTRHLADTISDGQAGCFMHGPTFMANPLACAAANASLVLLEQGDWPGQVVAIEEQLREALLPLAKLPGITDARVLGAIGVLEVDGPLDVAALQRLFVARGVWIRPFGRLIYLMPPYIIRPEQLRRLTDAMAEAASDIARFTG